MARTAGRLDAVALMRSLRDRLSEEFAALSFEEQRQRIRSDLKKQRRLWEDFYDRALAKQRASEPRESLETAKKRVLGHRPQRRRG